MVSDPTAAFITPSFFINDRSSCAAITSACGRSAGCALAQCPSGGGARCQLVELPAEGACTPAGSCEGSLMCRFPLDPYPIEENGVACSGFLISQGYGRTCYSKAGGAVYYVGTGQIHSGIAFRIPIGTPLYAVADGTLKCVGPGPCEVGNATSCWDQTVGFDHKYGKTAYACCPRENSSLTEEEKREEMPTYFPEGCPMDPDPRNDPNVPKEANSGKDRRHHRLVLTVKKDDREYDILYGHMYTTDPSLRVGQAVKMGTFLGRSGSAVAPHLHLDVRDQTNNAALRRNSGQRNHCDSCAETVRSRVPSPSRTAASGPQGRRV